VTGAPNATTKTTNSHTTIKQKPPPAHNATTPKPTPKTTGKSYKLNATQSTTTYPENTILTTKPTKKYSPNTSAHTTIPIGPHGSYMTTYLHA